MNNNPIDLLFRGMEKLGPGGFEEAYKRPLAGAETTSAEDADRAPVILSVVP
jgi:hypothetical protein